MKGGSGGRPREKFQKLKPIASISGYLVPFQRTVTKIKVFLILQQTKKTLLIGDKHYPPSGKKFKNWSQLQAFPGIWCHLQCNCNERLQSSFCNKPRSGTRICHVCAKLRSLCFVVMCSKKNKKNKKTAEKVGRPQPPQQGCDGRGWTVSHNSYHFCQSPF